MLVALEPQITACTQDRYGVLLGGVKYFVESTWSNDAQRSICYLAAYNKQPHNVFLFQFQLQDGKARALPQFLVRTTPRLNAEFS